MLIEKACSKSNPKSTYSLVKDKRCYLLSFLSSNRFCFTIFFIVVAVVLLKTVLAV